VSAEVSPRRQSLAAGAIGAAGGLAAGLLGIGGGLVMVPLLMLVLHAPIKRAVGTSLMGVLVTSVIAVATELIVAPGNIHWLAALLLSVGAVFGSWLGAKLIVKTPPRLLAQLLAAVLALAALQMSGVLGSSTPHDPSAAEPLAVPVLRGVAHVVAGVLAGIISAMFGIGGGLLAVPALAVLHPSWAFQACRATSLVMRVPASVAGALLHRKLANVDAALARGLVPGGIVGSIVGVLLANQLPGRQLKLVFAGLLVFAAARLVLNRRPA
jgi:uncharacterized membrane protein YfcA